MQEDTLHLPQALRGRGKASGRQPPDASARPTLMFSPCKCCHQAVLSLNT